MVLFIVNNDCIAALKAERYAPRAVDVNRIARWGETLKRVKFETREIHVLGCDGCSKSVQAAQYPAVHSGIEP